MNDPAGKSTVAATFFHNCYLLSNINYALCAESVRKYMIKYEYTLQ